MLCGVIIYFETEECLMGNSYEKKKNEERIQKIFHVNFSYCDFDHDLIRAFKIINHECYKSIYKFCNAT